MEMMVLTWEKKYRSCGRGAGGRERGSEMCPAAESHEREMCVCFCSIFFAVC